MIKHFVLVAAVCGASWFSASPARADSWIFQRSYYTHDPVTDVRIGRQTTVGGPYYSRPQGQYIRTGTRYINSTINVPGYGSDQYNVYESWIQYGQQY